MQSNSAEKQFKKMTEVPVKKLIVSLSVPTVISMAVTMIYNVADTYFVSHISVAASGATGIVFGLMAIIQAFGFMFGHGSGSCISRKLGAKKIDEARKYCSTGFFLALITALIISTLGIILITPIMRLLGSTETILPYAKTYAFYIFLAAPAMTTSCVMNNILRYEGMAKLAMFGLATGGILNIGLDPLLIYTFKLGIAGAGIATALSQYISMFILLFIFLLKKPQSRISLKYVSFKAAVIKEIILIGLPSLARQGLNSVSTMFLNIMASPFGDECIAAMSICAKCYMLIFSVCIGIGQGLQPVCSFNYGAERYDRVRSAVKFTWAFSTAVTSALGLIMFIFTPQIVEIFRSDARVIEIGSAALRYLCVSLLFMPTVMVTNMTFQSIGRSGPALFLACAQNGLFFVPLILILPRFLNETGIEISQPIGFVISTVAALPFLIGFLKELKQKI